MSSQALLGQGFRPAAGLLPAFSGTAAAGGNWNGYFMTGSNGFERRKTKMRFRIVVAERIVAP
jgi:hypothetical protein